MDNYSDERISSRRSSTDNVVSNVPPIYAALRLSGLRQFDVVFMLNNISVGLMRYFLKILAKNSLKVGIKQVQDIGRS